MTNIELAFQLSERSASFRILFHFFFETVRHQEGGRLEHIRHRADGQKSET